ncbi:MAG: HAD family phosphatase [Melioribacteraceae bacterium]|nr:HAD family phosphatase [Melioribacteraceae bacterium]
MEKSQIKIIVFDLGNVLIPFDYKIIIDNLNKIETGLGNKFENLYAENYHVHQAFEKAEISTDEFTKTMLGWLDNKIDAEQFYHIYSDLFTVNEEMVELLPILKQNYKLVLLSNTNYIHQKYGWEKYDFLNHFDKLILSHEVGARKPEENIYKAVESYTGENPETHFFTDDVQEYVQAAKSLGWDAVQFRSADEYKTALKERNII